jgi:hypothetical protein
MRSILIRIFTVAPVFGYFLFFVGRAYSEAYLKNLEIPPSAVKYDFFDYVYFGAQIDTIIITVIFTLIFFGLIWYFKMETVSLNKYKKGDLIFTMIYLPYSVIGLVMVSLVLIFNKDGIKEPAIIVFSIATGLMASGLIIMLLADKGLIQRIKRGRNLSRLFVTSAVITLLCFPFIISSAWGAFKVYSSPYKELNLSPNTLVEISARYPLINDVNWEDKGDNLYVTTDELFLILKNDTNLFIKTNLKDSKTYIISTSNIISYNIHPKQ